MGWELAGQSAHIGPEHAHALTAMRDRARSVIAGRRLTETACAVPGFPAVPQTPARTPTRPADRTPTAPSSASEPAEDEDFHDGRWTSDRW